MRKTSHIHTYYDDAVGVGKAPQQQDNDIVFS